MKDETWIQLVSATKLVALPFSHLPVCLPKARM